MVAAMNTSAADHKFFRALVLLLALLALAGFAPSYYLRPLFNSPVEMTTLKHIHGAIFTLWVVLLVAQVTLVNAKRIDWHRRLGLASVALAMAMMAAVATLALERTRVWLDDPQFDAGDVLMFLLTPLTTVLYFSCMYGTAIALRHRSAIHKRLMLLANLDLFTPAVSRLPTLGDMSTTWHYLAIDLLLVALAVHDWRTLRKLHPATVWGGIALVASQVGREVLAKTDTWMDIAVWLTA